MFLTLPILGMIVVTVFVAVGLAVASAVLPLIIILAVLAGAYVLCVQQEDRPVATSSVGRSPLRVAAGVGAGALLGVYTLIGMTALLGSVATALAGATVLAVLGYGRLRGRVGLPSPTADRADPEREDAVETTTRRPRLPTADPADLSTDELCRAWRASYQQLHDARAPEALEVAAELRRRYLDELARRQPEGFRRWLDAGAHAASDPSRYVRPSSAPDEPEDDGAT